MLSIMPCNRDLSGVWVLGLAMAAAVWCGRLR